MIQCVHSYLIKCREVVLQILTMFLKPSLKELKFHMGNISQKKISENKNLFKTHLGRVNFFVFFSNIKKVEKVDPPHIFFEQFLFSEIFFWEIFPIWNLSSFKLGFKNIVKIRSTTSRHFIRYDWTHCTWLWFYLVVILCVGLDVWMAF